MADRIDIKCQACRLMHSISIHNLRAVGGTAYIECPGCHYYNFTEDIKEYING